MCPVEEFGGFGQVKLPQLYIFFFIQKAADTVYA